jgi:hypothetical protein
MSRPFLTCAIATGVGSEKPRGNPLQDSQRNLEVPVDAAGGVYVENYPRLLKLAAK